MSKIHNALKRIRDAKAGQSTPPSRQEALGQDFTEAPVALDETARIKIPVAEPVHDDTIARLSTRPSLTDSGGQDVEERFVEVDRDRLREAGLLAPESQSRMLADQYRLIKRPLLDNAVGKNASIVEDGNLIMISSALSGDGKTFTCINLALSMASEKDMTILLVDADVAKPHISRIFGVSKQPGLIDLLLDESLTLDDVILKTDVPGLRLLPSGQIHDQATELLASKRMRSLVQQLSKRYANRAVVFDSPPLLVTPEARVLGSHMGQIAMVVCAGKTPQQAVLDAVACIDESKAMNLILNQSLASGLGASEYGYGYGYGYGHAEAAAD
ncbi:MAG: XrtA-associated tyrosine autokinase [Pseudomonadota bacterium]